jgi:hypothetical protein
MKFSRFFVAIWGFSRLLGFLQIQIVFRDKKEFSVKKKSKN